MKGYESRFITGSKWEGKLDENGEGRKRLKALYKQPP